MKFLSKKLPNYLTIFRFVIIPILILSFYIPGRVANLVAASLFALAAITDYFDGYFARSLNAETQFGKCLDPIADKLIVIIAIVLLINFSSQDFYILIPGIIIIAREVLVSGLREFLAGLNVSVPVSKLAKYKTAFQMISITGLLLGENGSSYTIDYFSSGLNEMGLRFIIIDFIVYASKILFAFSSILTVVTGFVYFRVGLKEM